MSAATSLNCMFNIVLNFRAIAHGLYLLLSIGPTFLTDDAGNTEVLFLCSLLL